MDAEQLAGIYVELGEARAQAVIGRAMEELSVTLEQIGAMVRSRRRSAARQLAERIRDIAEPLGLCSLALVACDVAQVAGTRDTVALTSTHARLERIANRSLKMVWDLQDISG